MHDYEKGYLAGQQHRENGGDLRAGNFHHEGAPPYSQGFVDGYQQTQGRIVTPSVHTGKDQTS
jgi:hypothetical protein